MSNTPVVSNCEIIPYKKRDLDPHTIIEVYKNLHKNCYSIRQLGKVIGHTTSLCMTSCYFVVNINGKQRAIATNQKNVHAFIKGYFLEISNYNTTNQTLYKITYDPYTNSTFMLVDGDKEVPIHKATYCFFTKSGAYTHIT